MHTVQCTEQLIREGDTVVAHCPTLDVSSCGYSVEEARASLQTAVRLFLEEAAQMGTLKQTLTESG